MTAEFTFSVEDRLIMRLGGRGQATRRNFDRCLPRRRRGCWRG
jgi:hypothetical protein